MSKAVKTAASEFELLTSRKAELRSALLSAQNDRQNAERARNAAMIDPALEMAAADRAMDKAEKEIDAACRAIERLEARLSALAPEIERAQQKLERAEYEENLAALMPLGQRRAKLFEEIAEAAGELAKKVAVIEAVDDEISGVARALPADRCINTFSDRTPLEYVLGQLSAQKSQITSVILARLPGAVIAAARNGAAGYLIQDAQLIPDRERTRWLNVRERLLQLDLVTAPRPGQDRPAAEPVPTIRILADGPSVSTPR